jgi:hypothetical protein
VDVDSESELFKPRGFAEFESEWSKWMKQQPMPRDTNILTANDCHATQIFLIDSHATQTYIND